MSDETALRRTLETVELMLIRCSIPLAVFFGCAIGPQLMAQQAPPTGGSYDVVIRDGRFVMIGFVPGHGRVEIDERDKYVSPGWIDMMDQSGSVLLRNTLAENKLREGITTAMIDWVLVNGVVTIDHGKHTGVKAGQVVYGPGRNVSAQTIPNQEMRQ